MPTGKITLHVYKLGEGYPVTPEGKRLYSYPYTVYYTPDADYPFYMGSGDARNGNGSFLSAKDMLRPEWQSDLQRAEAEWLIPLLERFAQGENITSAEILETYRQVHGKLPPHEDWTLY